MMHKKGVLLKFVHIKQYKHTLLIKAKQTPEAITEDVSIPEELQQVNWVLFLMIQLSEVQEDVEYDQFYVDIRIHQRQ